MEKAFYISDPLNLRFINSLEYQRIYFGQEYCEFLIPTAHQLEKIIAFSAQAKLALTLVTPIANDQTLKKLKALMRLLPQNSEVVFNDWGVFELIQNLGFKAVHGRLLCSIKKDPRINSQQSFINYFRTHNLQETYQAHLINLKIDRVELDNVKQGYDLKLLPPLQSTLYYPFVTTSVTRKCLFAHNAQPASKLQVVTRCNFECHQQKISSHLDGAHFFVEGKAQYYVNNQLPAEDTSHWNWNRSVFMPKFPTTNSLEVTTPQHLLVT